MSDILVSNLPVFVGDGMEGTRSGRDEPGISIVFRLEAFGHLCSMLVARSFLLSGLQGAFFSQGWQVPPTFVVVSCGSPCDVARSDGACTRMHQSPGLSRMAPAVTADEVCVRS